MRGKINIISIPNKYDSVVQYLFSIKDSILNQAPLKKVDDRKHETFVFLVASKFWKKLKFI